MRKKNTSVKLQRQVDRLDVLTGQTASSGTPFRVLVILAEQAEQYKNNKNIKTKQNEKIKQRCLATIRQSKSERGINGR